MEQYNTQFKEYIFVIIIIIYFFCLVWKLHHDFYICIYFVFRFSLLNVFTYYLIKLFVDNAQIHKHPNYVCIYIICIHYICMFIYMYIECIYTLYECIYN